MPKKEGENFVWGKSVFHHFPLTNKQKKKKSDDDDDDDDDDVLLLLSFHK